MRGVDIDKSLRRFQLAGFLSIIAMIAVFGGWSGLSKIQGAVVAPATLVAESYAKKIQHKDGGIVRQILVSDGDRVEENQALIILDDSEPKAELGIIDALLHEHLANHARLVAQRDKAGLLSFDGELLKRQSEPTIATAIAGQRRLFESRRVAIEGKKQQLNKQIGQLGEQGRGLEAQREAEEKQLAFITDELGDMRALLKKALIQKSRVLALEREAARLAGERGELIATRAATETKAAEIELQILQIDEEALSQTLTELREVEAKIAELQERKLAAAAKLQRIKIVAPIAGDVYELSVHTVGGVIAAGEPVMLIAPKGDDLVLQAQVSPKDIDQVQIGQAAHVRFPTFNLRQTPEIGATVIQVSADTSRAGPDSPPFYAVRLKIPADELAQLGEKKLKPGMTAEAFIQTNARSPLSFFLKPLMDQVAHAFREE